MLECCSLEWVFALFVDDIFAHVTCSCITMHCSSFSFFFFFSFLAYLLLLSLSLQSIFPWHPKRAFLNVISFPVLLLHLLLFLLTSNSLIQTTIRLLRRTSFCILFMLNVRFFYLSFQTLWYSSRLDLMDGTFSVNAQLPTRVCLYKSSTLTYILSIPLYPSSLRVFMVHIPLLLQSLSLKYSMFHGQLALITLARWCSHLFLKMYQPLIL